MMKRTRHEIGQAIVTMLMDEVWQMRSNRAIATVVGAHPTTIERYRKMLEAANKISSSVYRVGRDGEMYRIKSNVSQNEEAE